MFQISECGDYILYAGTSRVVMSWRKCTGEPPPFMLDAYMVENTPRGGRWNVDDMTPYLPPQFASTILHAWYTFIRRGCGRGDAGAICRELTRRMRGDKLFVDGWDTRGFDPMNAFERALVVAKITGTHINDLDATKIEFDYVNWQIKTDSMTVDCCTSA